MFPELERLSWCQYLSRTHRPRAMMFYFSHTCRPAPVSGPLLQTSGLCSSLGLLEASRKSHSLNFLSTPDIPQHHYYPGSSELYLLWSPWSGLEHPLTAGVLGVGEAKLKLTLPLNSPRLPAHPICSHFTLQKSISGKSGKKRTALNEAPVRILR